MSSFQTFRSALVGAFPDEHARGKQFERICKWFLETDARFVARLEEVWLWDDWPGKWGPDCGIDLVARDRDGKTWAIQAKCYKADRRRVRRPPPSNRCTSIYEAAIDPWEAGRTKYVWSGSTSR